MKKAKKLKKARKAAKTAKRNARHSRKPKPARSAKTAKPAPQVITGNMTFGIVIDKYPDVAFVMLKYGLHCVGCHIASYETIEEGARAHGLDEKTVKKMIDEMNKIAATYKKK